MDWGILISAIISILTCGGVVWWVIPKAAKKKPELENENTAVETMRDAIAEIRKSNDHFQEINAEKEKTIEDLRVQLLECQKDLSLATTYICANCGCSKRLPPSRGSGEKWLQQLKKGEVSPNYDPLKCEYILAHRDFDSIEEN